METLGQKIKAARDSVGLTQEQLAFAIGAAGQSTVGNYEQGVNEPAISVLHQIATVTGWPLALFVTDTDFAVDVLPQPSDLDKLLTKTKLLAQQGQLNGQQMATVQSVLELVTATLRPPYGNAPSLSAYSKTVKQKKQTAA